MRTSRCAALKLLCVGLFLAATADGSFATVVTTEGESKPLGGTQLEADTRPSFQADDFDAARQEAAAALARGRWPAACSIATRTLANQFADPDALGLFGLCAALRKDGPATDKALARLSTVEAPPRYVPLIKGIQQLQAKRPELAEESFRSVLASRPNDPLANYFLGEALHMRGRSADAVTAFKVVLVQWPEHGPALTAAARVLAAPKATPAELNEAVALTERATRADPTNRAQWKLLADLYRRTGQVARADAVEMQWVRSPVTTR